MDPHYARFVKATMAGKGLRGRIGPVQGSPVEEDHEPGKPAWKEVVPEADPVVGVMFEMDRTASVEADLNAPCAQLVIEASYDGGKTWQHLHSAEIAGGSIPGRGGRRVASSAVSVIGWGGELVPTHTRCGLIAHKPTRTTTRVRPLLLEVTPLPLG